MTMKPCRSFLLWHLALIAYIISLAAAKLILVGDSTLANDNYGNVAGWGRELQTALQKGGVSIEVDNSAVPGSNSHTWTDQGLFDKVGAKISSGDYVLIEMGTNEKGDISAFDQLVGAAVKSYKAKGAHIILASMVPHNPFSGGTQGGAYVTEMSKLAQQLGADYVDMNSAAYSAMKSSGSASMYTDSLHTTAAGATLIANAAVPLLKPILGGGGGGGGSGTPPTTKTNSTAATAGGGNTTPGNKTTPTTGGGGIAGGKPPSWQMNWKTKSRTSIKRCQV